jgi:hypothetical protein
MKKIALMASALLAGAAVADAPAHSFAGFYTGLNAGATYCGVQASYAESPVTTSQNFKQNFGKFGFQGGLFGGYNFAVAQNVIVGAELFMFGDSTNIKTAQSATPSSTPAASDGVSIPNTAGVPGISSVKRSFGYGLAFRAGCMVTPSTLLYVRLGLEAGRWQASFNPANGWSGSTTTVPLVGGPGNIGSAAVTPTMNAATAKKNGLAFAPGIGVEMLLSKNTLARLQYHHVFGPKITVPGNGNVKTVVTSPTANGASVTYNNVMATGTGAATTATGTSSYTATQTYKTSGGVVSLAIAYKF